MKTLNKVFIAAIAATAMTACNNELGEQFVSNNGGDVKFTMGIEGTSASRVAMEDGSYQASFENENKVGVFVKEVDSYSNLEYTFDGNAWNGATIKVPADKVYTYYAYYPYAESATSTAVATEVNADQETGGYLANDYLMANLTAEAGQANVNLQFTHALSLVEVTLSGPNAAEDAVVTLSNMTTDATMNLEASTVTPGEKKANVTMDKLTTSMKYRAIVPEQTVAQGTALMTIVSKGRTYKVSYKASDVKFERGKYISLNVELGSSSSAEDVTVTVTSQRITNWYESDGVTGDASISVAELNIPLPVDVKLDTIKYNWSASTSANQIGTDKKEGWYKRSGSSVTNLTVVGYDESEGAMTIKRFVDSDGAWNSDNITYHSCTPLEIGQYELSFELKGATEGGGTTYGTVGVGISASGDSTLFRIPILADIKDTQPLQKDYGRTLTTKAATTEWVSVSISFDFTKTCKSGKSNGLAEKDCLEATVEKVNKGVNIMFYSHNVANIKAPTTLYVRNIKLTKVE
ncbi:fimbrillin family protein [Phocaeicola plebeius]|uniref:fimbrillin family protein n=1 Tax=Phocaeicola plebeius TaxID=310297 RepID=UPI003FEE7AA5